VVVILGIASAIIIPQMGTRDDLRAAAAARTVVADLIYAQNQAITSGTPVYVKFDVTNNRYSLLKTANSGGDVVLTNPITQNTYVEQFGSTVKGWEGISISSAVLNGTSASYQPTYTLAFDEIGAPYAFSYVSNDKNDLNDGTIVLQCGTFTTTVKVSAATGEITVQ
jgi:Tfp pilus assembly protein FimT